MVRTSIIRMSVALAALAALAVPATALADPTPTQVTLGNTAQYVSSGLVNVQVTISCTPGWGYNANVQMIQPQGFTQIFGSGFVNGLCTGQHQKLAVQVFANFFPGWQLGDAVASVTACSQGCDTTTREVRISMG
jgi:hypothetical protein